MQRSFTLMMIEGNDPLQSSTIYNLIHHTVRTLQYCNTDTTVLNYTYIAISVIHVLSYSTVSFSTDNCNNFMSSSEKHFSSTKKCSGKCSSNYPKFMVFHIYSAEHHSIYKTSVGFNQVGFFETHTLRVYKDFTASCPLHLTVSLYFPDKLRAQLTFQHILQLLVDFTKSECL